MKVLGCLANMTIYDLPATSNWSKLVGDYKLLSLFSKFLSPGMVQNDILLEIVMLIGNIASDPQVLLDLLNTSIMIIIISKILRHAI
jgi:hypothetical protein